MVGWKAHTLILRPPTFFVEYLAGKMIIEDKKLKGS
jgi:hypothetical protein